MDWLNKLNNSSSTISSAAGDAMRTASINRLPSKPRLHNTPKPSGSENYQSVINAGKKASLKAFDEAAK